MFLKGNGYTTLGHWLYKLGSVLVFDSSDYHSWSFTDFRGLAVCVY